MIREGDEPAWKGLVSYCTLFLLVTAIGFWFTIAKPEEMRVLPSEGVVHGKVSEKDEELNVYLCSQQVLTDIDDMEPSKLLRDGDVDGALGAARDLLSKDKWNVKNLMCVGNVFVAAPKENGVNAEGYKYLQDAVHLCPQSKYVRLNYARALARGERFEEAIDQYDKVVKGNLDTIPSLELARCYMDVDQDKAIKLLHDMIEKQPDNSAVQMLLGIAMAKNNDEKGGYEEYVQAFGKARTVGYPFEAREIVAKNHDSIPDAIKEQRAVASSAVNAIEPKLLLAEMLIVQNQMPEALAVLNPEKEKYKDNAELHRLYAEIYHSDNKEEEAYKEWVAANNLEKQVD